MLVNETMKLADRLDRPHLDRLLDRLGNAELQTWINDGPNAFPLDTFVVFSADHGSYDGLRATVDVTLRESGLSRYLEESP